MATDIALQLTSASVRICGLALVALVGLSVFRIRSSAAKHAMWTVVLIGMLFQIPLQIVAPPMRLKMLPMLAAPAQPQLMQSAPLSMPTPRPTPPASHAPEPVKFSTASWRTIVMDTYLAISLLLLLRLAFGCWVLQKIVCGSTPIPSLGPHVFESTRVIVPGSVGAFGARILLPRAWRDWDAARLAAILAHERAHIQRYDWLTHLASRINICIFWFHPLAWWIDRELARLAEEASDDVAVSETKDKEEYVVTLVDIARTAASSRGVLSWPLISMATDSTVTRRVNRILRQSFQVPKPLSRFSWAALSVSGVPVIYLSAVVGLAPVGSKATTLKDALVSPPRAEALVQPLSQEYRSRTGVVSDVASNQKPDSLMLPAPSQREQRPLAICILLDSSGSMDEKRDEVMTTALALVKASKPHDEVCILRFDDEVFNSLPNAEDFTSNTKEMEDAISRTDARGGKAMRDAVLTGLDYLALATHNERRVLVLITEGFDTSSKVSQQDLLDKVKSSGVPIYCIGLLSEKDSQRRDAARLALNELADASRGLAIYPNNVTEAQSISRQIANEAGNR